MRRRALRRRVALAGLLVTFAAAPSPSLGGARSGSPSSSATSARAPSSSATSVRAPSWSATSPGSATTAGSATSAGVGLGLFASDPEWDYGPLVTELAALPARDVLVVVPWVQDDVAATQIRPRPGTSPSEATVRRTLRQLRDAGIAVTLMPIVLLGSTTHPKQWRGVIAPVHEGAPAVRRWFDSYGQFIGAHAVLAKEAGVRRLVVGSELLSMESERARWLALIGSVRGDFDGPLVYSANWDHFRDVSFWDALDAVGVNGYFRLAADGARPTEPELVAAWAEPLRALAALRAELGLPLLLTEVGYPSRSTAAAKPWCACPAEPVDAELQERLIRAMFGAFAGPEALPFDAFYLWNWFGPRDAADGGYSPRGKPAEAALRDGLAAFRRKRAAPRAFTPTRAAP